MNLKIAVLSGDGIGPEVTLQAKKALHAIGVVYNHEFVFEDAYIGSIAIEKTGKPLPEQTLNLCRNTDSILFGAGLGEPCPSCCGTVYCDRKRIRILYFAACAPGKSRCFISAGTFVEHSKKTEQRSWFVHP